MRYEMWHKVSFSVNFLEHVVEDVEDFVQDPSYPNYEYLYHKHSTPPH